MKNRYTNILNNHSVFHTIFVIRST